MLAGVVGGADSPDRDPRGRVGRDLHDAGRHGGRGGVEGEHEHGSSLTRVLWITAAAEQGGDPQVGQRAVPRGAPIRAPVGQRPPRRPHDTPDSLSQRPGPDPRGLRAPARGGGALAGRPGPPHRPRPLRADLRGVRHRLRARGLPDALGPDRRLPRPAVRHPELVLAARLPVAGRDPAGDVGVVRLPGRDEQAGPRERPAVGAAQAAAVLRRPGRAGPAPAGRRAAPRRVRVPPAVPRDRPAAQPSGHAVRVGLTSRRSALAGRPGGGARRRVSRPPAPAGAPGCRCEARAPPSSLRPWRR